MKQALGRLATDTVEAPDGTTTASISYDYDDEDQLTTKTTTGLAGAATNTYTYDQAGRLTSWDDGTTVHDYEWDAAGNLTRDGPDTATYNERNQLQAHGDTTYTYTPRGTLISRTTNGTTTTQQFNAFDELVTDGTTTNTYDGLNRLITTGAASLTYLGTSINVVSDGDGNYTYTPAGTMLGAQHNATPGLAWTDQHTDLIGLIEPTTGETAGSRAYSPFGETLAATGTQPALGYQHQYTNPDNGTINMGARWYQPGTGTFTSRDTTALHPRDLANANRYAYAAGSPLTRTDPSGGTVAVCALGFATGPGAPAAVGGCLAVNGAIALGAMVVGALTVKAVTDAPPRTYNPPRTRTRPSRPTVRRPAPRLDGWTSWLRLSLPLIDGWAAWPDRDQRPKPNPGCLLRCVPVKPPNLPEDGGTAGPTPGNTNQAAYEAYLPYLVLQRQGVMFGALSLVVASSGSGLVDSAPV
ncbi:RHS repeat-associated core domain protein [Saccharomonospora marina XMU15]|uniref:RHS repeat-associated core domain protein n=1 Tax=Saccharomonospora marina XMU15 TaxID=882083 RepID=H5X8K3_9PSEU|nr:RHS repeat-associated core domain-containing protein [Saccharomonospora marina]EHR51372.1 RHS repeat-associated core domain protein [Saccharomonospora marina XMU15]